MKENEITEAIINPETIFNVITEPDEEDRYFVHCPALKWC